MKRRQKQMLARIITAAAGTLLLNLISLGGISRLALFGAVYLLIGYDILWSAILGIWNRQFLDENFLMAIATVGAFALAVFTGSGDYNEAVAVMLFYQTGELFQSIAVGKSRKNIADLMDIRPDYANVVLEDVLIKVEPSLVSVGTLIVVQPGERVPIDGRITDGSSTLDTSALTGESIPRAVSVGDEVISGAVNREGVLRIVTEREYGESTVSKILELVENASSRKSRSEKFISKFARVYTPAVCLSALALAVLPPLFLGEWLSWLYRALTFLVISCPCALVVSIPLSFFAGIGCASREGILVKGSNYLEALAEVKTVALDKTGTLTHGVFEVSDVIEATLPRERIIELAAHAEAASSHPIAQSLIASYGKAPDRTRVTNVRELAGLGVTCEIDGVAVAAGNRRLIKNAPEYSGASTAVYLSFDGNFCGIILISDSIKENSREAIGEMRSLGIRRAVMLTGDNEAIARSVADELGITEYRASLLPADKLTAVEGMLSGKGKVAFVGDGINDAPVLAIADVGIAMGGVGSDAAIEAADVVLMKDDPLDIAKAIRISRKTLAIVKQNVLFSIAVKFGCLLLVALGFADMWLGIFADVGVMVVAVLNATRAMRIRNIKPRAKLTSERP